MNLIPSIIQHDAQEIKGQYANQMFFKRDAAAASSSKEEEEELLVEGTDTTDNNNDGDIDSAASESEESLSDNESEDSESELDSEDNHENKENNKEVTTEAPKDSVIHKEAVKAPPQAAQDENKSDNDVNAKEGVGTEETNKSDDDDDDEEQEESEITTQQTDMEKEEKRKQAIANQAALEAKAIAEATASADASYTPSASVMSNASPYPLLKSVDGTSLTNKHNQTPGIFMARNVPIPLRGKLNIPIHVTSGGSIVEYTVQSQDYDIGFGVIAEREEGVTVVTVSEQHCILLWYDDALYDFIYCIVNAFFHILYFTFYIYIIYSLTSSSSSSYSTILYYTW